MSMDPADSHSWLGPVLSNLGVASFEADFSGSGDSGQMDEVRFKDANGAELSSTDILAALQRLPLHSKGGFMSNFEVALDEMMGADADNEGNYYDNEGGFASVSYSVSPHGIEKTGGYYEPGSYEDDDEYDPDDDEDPDEEDLEEEDPAP